MRLLFVTSYYKPAFVYGGPVYSVAAMCEGLAKLGVEVTISSTNASGNKKLDVPLGTPVHINNTFVWYFPLNHNVSRFYYSKEQSKWLNQQLSNFDLIIAGSLWSHCNIIATNLCIEKNIPYVMLPHGQLNPWAIRNKGFKKWFYMLLFAKNQLTHAASIQCSDSIEVDALRKLGIKTPTFVIPFGIDLNDFGIQYDIFALRKKFNIQNNDKVLLFLGRLSKIKRPDIAIHSLSYASKTIDNIKLFIVGPDEDKLIPDLRKLSQRLGVTDKVHFLGLLQHDEIITLLSIVDLLLMPSEVQENFGMSCLEAMAAGVPILVSYGIPIGERAQEAGAGLRVEATVESFSRATEYLLNHPEILRKMGEKGKETVLNEFNQDILARKLLFYYKNLANQSY